MFDISIFKKAGLLSDGVCDRLGFTFDCMDIAEQEIKAAKKRQPNAESLIDRMFGSLCPPEGMYKFGRRLYRAYVKEQLQRVIDGKPIDEATDTELLMVFASMMEKAPLTPDASKLCFDLFAKVFPEHAELSESILLYESYTDVCKVIADDIRKHIGKIQRRSNR